VRVDRVRGHLMAGDAEVGVAAAVGVVGVVVVPVAQPPKRDRAAVAVVEPGGEALGHQLRTTAASKEGGWGRAVTMAVKWKTMRTRHRW
jgi:hypothetical protein